MVQKATTRQANSNAAAVPVMLFGVDANGKPKVARFVDKHADLASKAAAQLNLQVLQIVGPTLTDLAARLPQGRIHANGRGFVPFVRKDLYAKIVAAAGSPNSLTNTPVQLTTGSGSAASNSGNAPGLPQNWDSIKTGDVVIALQDPEDGWYEAIVAEIHGEMLTMRWRHYPRERRFTRHRLSVGLMCPEGGELLPAAGTVSETEKKAQASSSQSADAETVAYPRTWAEIEIDCLVLAKEDGPARSWWEAVPISKSNGHFQVRWRDYSTVPSVTRPRLSLGLLYPNGR